METIIKDLRYAVRMLVSRPGFSLIAITVLALGIGANTSIFSVVNSVLLNPLPYEKPDRLVIFKSTNMARGLADFGISMPDFREWRKRNASFEQMSAFSGTNYNISGGGEPERVAGATASSNLFELLRVNPAMGRSFTNDEETFGNHRVAIISYGLWQRRFASNTSILDQAVTLNGETFTIIGVMPRGFAYPDPTIDVWTPLALPEDNEYNTRGNYWLSAIGRLKPGVSLAQASAEMTSIAERIDEETEDIGGIGVRLLGLREEAVGRVETLLWVLLGAVGLVLLIACANVANLLLARSAARQKEMAIRMAMGATRAQIIRQLLIESLLMGMVGGGLGCLLAVWGVEALVKLSPQDLPRLSEIRVDSLVFLFTLAVSVVTGAIFGLAPAIHASKTDINSLLKEGARGSAASHSSLSRSALVAAEVAISLVLLICAGLMINSFLRLTRVDPGFRTERILTMLIALPEARYPEDRPQQSNAFFDQLIARTGELPGVESVAVTSSLPLTNTGWGKLFSVEVHPRPATIDEVPLIQYRQVSSDYFQTLSIRLLSGRLFNSQDGSETERVAIINETLAGQFFSGEDPIGKRIFLGPPEEMIPPGLAPEGFRFPRMTIVGVVHDTHHDGLTQRAQPEVYSLHIQNTAFETHRTMFLAVRTSIDPMSLTSAVRSQVLSLDSEQPISEVATMDHVLARSLAQSRFSAMMLGLFASVALLLAAVGIYGVISYSVACRTHEIGIRLALGAASGDILRMVIRQGMARVLIGAAAGLAGAFAATRVMESLLYEVSATDPVTFAAITAMLTIVALLACYIPARRAMKVDPITALRYE